jgi:hypothetical protein
MKVRLSNLLWVSTFAFGTHASVVTFKNEDENNGYWMRYLETDGDLSLPPIPPPTPAPVPPETASPTKEPQVACEILVDIVCQTQDGVECADIVPPPLICSTGEGIEYVTFLYQPSECPGKNFQGDEAFCEDMAPLEPQASVEVLCKNFASGDDLAVEPPTVQPGSTFTVSAPMGPMLDKIDCIIQNEDGVKIQQVVIDASGTVNLQLKDQFGSFILVSCAPDGEAQSCLETLCYKIQLDNIGTVLMEVTVADFTLNGETESFLDLFPDTSIDVGQSENVEVKKEVDICSGNTYTVEIDVEASPPNGPFCKDTDIYEFTPPLPDTLAPVPPVTPAPSTPAPTPELPTPLPTPPPQTPPTPPPVTPGSPPPVLPPVPPPVTPAPAVPESPPPVSPPVPPPMPPPVSPPVSPPIPPPEQECTIALESDCTVTNTANGQSQQCEGAVPNLEPCTSRPTAITMLFNGGDCSQSDNIQPDKFFCTDLGPISTELGTPYYIVVTDAKGNGITYFSDIVNVGDFYNLGDGTERFEADQIIQIYTPDQSTMLQDVQYHSSCSQNLELKNRFGANQLVEFLNDEQGLVSCFETFSFSLNIAVPISVSGEAITLTKLTADTNFAGLIDLTDQVAGQTVEPGGSVVATLEGEVDFSTAQTYTLDFDVEGTNASGDLCVGQETVSFEAGGIPPRPPSAPTTGSKKGGKKKRQATAAPSPPAISPVY